MKNILMIVYEKKDINTISFAMTVMTEKYELIDDCLLVSSDALSFPDINSDNVKNLKICNSTIHLKNELENFINKYKNSCDIWVDAPHIEQTDLIYFRLYNYAMLTVLLQFKGIDPTINRYMLVDINSKTVNHYLIQDCIIASNIILHLHEENLKYRKEQKKPINKNFVLHTIKHCKESVKKIYNGEVGINSNIQNELSSILFYLNNNIVKEIVDGIQLNDKPLFVVQCWHSKKYDNLELKKYYNVLNETNREYFIRNEKNEIRGYEKWQFFIPS